MKGSIQQKGQCNWDEKKVNLFQDETVYKVGASTYKFTSKTTLQ